MTKKALLDTLKEFTETVTKNVILPCAVQQGDTAQQFRAADVYLMRLPDQAAAKKKVPYIIHQLVTAKDQQPAGETPSSIAVVRTVFVVYGQDEQEGSLALLDLMETVRLALERQIVIGKRFQLDMETGVDQLIYPDDTKPYFIGEMSTTWKIPAIQREVRAVCL